MHLLSTIAGLMPLLTITLGQAYQGAQWVPCAPYIDDPKIGWTDQGYLTQNLPTTGRIYKWDHKAVLYNHDNGYRHYWYGIYAEVRNDGTFFAQVDRDGKGQGQQFRIVYKSADGGIVAQYWMTPGKFCTITPNNIMASDVTSVQVYSRTTA